MQIATFVHEMEQMYEDAKKLEGSDAIRASLI